MSESTVNDHDAPSHRTPDVSKAVDVTKQAEELARTHALQINTAPDASTIVAVSKGVFIFGAPLAAGDKIGKYEIRSLLGQGGMGAVYRAFDPYTEREVALKVLSQDVGSNPTALQRFLGEALAIARLNSPHVVSIYEIDQWQGHYYLAMELLAGGSVADYAEQRGTLAWNEAFRIVAQAARGLAAAHAAGTIHRDIKPENLMLAADGAVKVVDFSLSKLLDSTGVAMTAIAKTGQVLGTPHYMSPEQFATQDVDARSDVYSLGVTLFRLLTGRFPYHDCKTVREIMAAHLTKTPPNLLEFVVDLPTDCARIIVRSMAKQAGERYQSAEEFAVDLERALVR